MLMAVHIFVTSESNFQICINKGLVALPEPKEGRGHIFDGLLSRIASIKENDCILMYIMGEKQLRGVWQAEGEPFYDNAPVWPDRVYPFRCKIKCTDFTFANSLTLNDINDLRNNGVIWTWSLQRATGSNSMFSISKYEYDFLLTEYMKINPFTTRRSIIPVPYPFHKPNILECIHLKENNPQYESSIMTLLNIAFSKRKFTEIFGNYSDSLCYVPTNLGTEIDFLLMYENPINPKQVVSYDIIEVKRDEFDEKGLKQLIGYESWFLQKKVSGDLKMVRTTAIAKSFSDDVMDYVERRRKYEDKPIKLLKYSCSDGNTFNLIPMNPES